MCWMQYCSVLPAFGAFQSIYNPPPSQEAFFPLNHVLKEQNPAHSVLATDQFSHECLELKFLTHLHSRVMLCPEARLSRAGFLFSFWDGTLAAQAGLQGGRWQVPAGLCYGIAFRKQHLHFNLRARTKISNSPIAGVRAGNEDVSFVSVAIFISPAPASAATHV